MTKKFHICDESCRTLIKGNDLNSDMVKKDFQAQENDIQQHIKLIDEDIANLKLLRTEQEHLLEKLYKEWK